jgi:hypothetical protein
MNQLPPIETPQKSHNFHRGMTFTKKMAVAIDRDKVEAEEARPATSDNYGYLR